MEDALLDRRPTALATPVRSYRVRWWLLFLATLVAGSQGGIWLLYGVIAEAVVEPLYGWDDGTIALLALWGPVGYLIAACPTAWLLDTCGPREACVAGATLVFAGSAARAARFATDSTGSVLAHIGQCLNALAGPVAMSIGPVLSAVWFPASERNAATAIAASANYGGTAVVFWLGSVCVPAGAPADVTRGCLWRLMLGFAVFSGLVLLLCLLTFKARPDSAPSRSATVAREAPLAGIQLLVHSHSFWMLALSYGIGNGVFQGWGSLLGPNMQGVLPAAEAEAQAGRLGCWGAVAGMVGGIGLGVCADRVRSRAGRRKALLVGACALAALCFAAFALACAPALLPATWVAATTPRLVAMYVTSIGGSMCINAAIPLYYELAVEATYPIAEGLTTTSLTLLQNLPAGVFLLMPLLPGLGTPGGALTQWMNWALVGACVVATLAVLPLEEPCRRLAVDAPASEATTSELPSAASEWAPPPTHRVDTALVTDAPAVTHAAARPRAAGA